MPNAKVLDSKKQQVVEIKEKIKNSKSIILVDYRGLTVEQDTALRNRLRKANVEYKVVKNSIIVFATKDENLDGLENYLSGPTAIALGDDECSAAKILVEFAKTADKLEIKAGVVEGKVISLKEVQDLANLPTKEVLVSKVLGGLNAPIVGFVNVLNGNIRGLVVALNAIATKKA